MAGLVTMPIAAIPFGDWDVLELVRPTEALVVEASDIWTKSTHEPTLTLIRAVGSVATYTLDHGDAPCVAAQGGEGRARCVIARSYKTTRRGAHSKAVD